MRDKKLSLKDSLKHIGVRKKYRGNECIGVKLIPVDDMKYYPLCKAYILFNNLAQESIPCIFLGTNLKKINKIWLSLDVNIYGEYPDAESCLEDNIVYTLTHETLHHVLNKRIGHHVGMMLDNIDGDGGRLHDYDS